MFTFFVSTSVFTCAFHDRNTEFDVRNPNIWMAAEQKL